MDRQACILVVDDDADIVNAVRLYLEKEGFCVYSAADGFEALDQQMGPNELFCMGRNERFLLLLDCTTPEQVQQRMNRFFTQIRRFRVSEHQNYQAVCSAGVRFVTHTTPDLERAITEAAMTAETTSGSRQDELLFFDPAIYEPVILRNQIEESMDSALMSGEFVMKLQPKIDLVTGRPG